MSDSQSNSSAGKPYRGVHMKCCNVYVRAYLNQEKSAFAAFCPKCAKQVRLNIVNNGGSSSQIFEAE